MYAAAVRVACSPSGPREVISKECMRAYTCEAPELATCDQTPFVIISGLDAHPMERALWHGVVGAGLAYSREICSLELSSDEWLGNKFCC